MKKNDRMGEAEITRLQSMLVNWIEDIEHRLKILEGFSCYKEPKEMKPGKKFELNACFSYGQSLRVRLRQELLNISEEITR